MEKCKIQWPIEPGVYGVVQLWVDMDTPIMNIPVLVFTEKSKGMNSERHLKCLQEWLDDNEISYEIINYQIGADGSPLWQGPAIHGDSYDVVGMGYVNINPDADVAEFFGNAPDHIKTTIKIDREFLFEIQQRYCGWKFIIK